MDRLEIKIDPKKIFVSPFACITNTSGENVPKLLEHLREHCGEFVVVGGPKETKKYSIEDLEKWSVVGIYGDVSKFYKPIKPVDSCKYCNINLKLGGVND